MVQDGHKLRNISNRDSDVLLRNNITDRIIIKGLQIKNSFTTSLFGLLNQHLSSTRGAVYINSKLLSRGLADPSLRVEWLFQE